MKTTIRYIIPVLFTANSFAAPAQADYTSFLRQVQLPSGVTMDVPLNTTTAQVTPGTAASGTSLSPLALDAGGARFEIYSVLKSAPMTSYKLSTAYVGVAVPQASIVIDTEDPYGKVQPAVSYENPSFATAAVKLLPVNVASTVRRTRIDRPFKVYVATSGLSSVVGAPDSQKKVNFCRQVLSYGTSNTGEGVSRTPETYASATPAQFLSNAVQCTTVLASEIPGSPRTLVRGEEIFTAWTLNDTQIPGQTIPPNMLASQRVQVWPMTTGSISGLTDGQLVRFAVPKVTFQYTDTYPGSTTYAQIYKGEKRLNVQGTIIPGTSRVNTTSHSENYLVTTGSDFDALFTSDGLWTLEMVTVSCFDTLRLGSAPMSLGGTTPGTTPTDTTPTDTTPTVVTVVKDGAVKVNGQVTTIE